MIFNENLSENRVVKALYLAPFHNRKHAVTGVADAPKVARPTARLCERLGILGRQTDFTHKGAEKIAAEVSSFPTLLFLDMIDKLSADDYAELKRAYQRDLQVQFGNQIVFDAPPPAAPPALWLDAPGLPFPAIWADRSIQVFNSAAGEKNVFLELRSNRTKIARAQLVPFGIGWASIDGETKLPRSPEEDCKNEMMGETSLQPNKIVPLGYNDQSNTLEGYVYETLREDGSASPKGEEEFVVGVIPAASFVAYTVLDQTTAELIPQIKMNDESFGTVVLGVEALADVALGRKIKARFYPSASPVSMAYAMDCAGPADPETGVKSIDLSRFRALVSSEGAPKIEPKNPDGTKAYYSLNQDIYFTIKVGAEDFDAVGRHHWAEHMIGATTAGLVKYSAKALREARAEGHISPVPQIDPIAALRIAAGNRQDYFGSYPTDCEPG